MKVEPCCESLLSYLIADIDPKKQGICIDVGVGTFAFYCEVFAQLNYSTIAVEPLPTQKLKQVCQRHHIQLIEACLSDHLGKQSLYLGKFAGLPNRNFSSLSPGWFGTSKGCVEVPTLTLQALVQTISTSITCLKLDIEGWELNVLKQLPELTSQCLPKIIMFEYGGGGCKKRKTGGWNRERLALTSQCLKILQRCGYQTLIVIDFSPQSSEKIIDLLSLTDHDSIFEDHYIYGNAIALQASPPSPQIINSLCSPYYKMSVIENVISWLFSR